jgi:hypothetical protein
LEFYQKILKAKLSAEYIVQNMNNVEKMMNVLFTQDQRKVFDVTSVDDKFNKKNICTKELNVEDINEAYKRLLLYNDLISRNLLLLNS